MSRHVRIFRPAAFLFSQPDAGEDVVVREAVSGNGFPVEFRVLSGRAMKNAVEKSGKRLHRKALLVAGAGMITLFVFLLVTSKLFMLDSYELLEEREVQQSVRRALSCLDNEIFQLGTVVGDYAGWDDTYRFVRDGNAGYIKSNLTEETFGRLRINVILFVGPSGRIVYERLIDRRNPGMRAAPASLHRYVSASGPLVRHERTDSNRSGILMIPEGPLLVVSRPVLTSEYKGPIRGALIMGRFLDSDEVARLAGVTHLSFQLLPLGGPGAMSGIEAVRGPAGENRRILLQRLSQESASGYTVINDVFGKPALLMRLDLPRDVFRQGLASIRYYIVLVMSIGLVAAILGCVLYTKLRKAHDELERRVTERTAELREKDRILMLQSRQAAMGEMIGNIAHQWRQPLNSLGCIVQSLPLMLDSGELNRSALESMADKVMGIILHMSHTIDDFRNYFKPDKEKTRFYVFKAVSRTVSFIEESFRSQGISVNVRADDNPVINGYPNEYSQVLLNILINARDAFVERKTELPLVTIIISGESGSSVVTIADNAGGIPEDLIDKVFDPYFTTKAPDKGTGVGLFMSKGIIERNMGGRLTVRNTEHGAEFMIQV